MEENLSEVETRIGDCLSRTEPSPSWPWLLPPQHHAVPSASRPQGWSLPAEIVVRTRPPAERTGQVESSWVPSPNSPVPLDPQQSARPASVRPQVCSSAALTRVKRAAVTVTRELAEPVPAERRSTVAVIVAASVRARPSTWPSPSTGARDASEEENVTVQPRMGLPSAVSAVTASSTTPPSGMAASPGWSTTLASGPTGSTGPGWELVQARRRRSRERRVYRGRIAWSGSP